MLNPALMPKALALRTRPVATMAISEIRMAARLMDRSEPLTYPEVARILPSVALDRVPAAAPGADAAIGDVHDSLEALALQDRGGQAAALAAAADRGDRPVARELPLPVRELAVGQMDGAREVGVGELVAISDVEDEQVAGSQPLGELVRVDQLDPAHRSSLGAPGGHPALEVAAHP